jgi:arylsulfatase A-like enzyme
VYDRDTSSRGDAAIIDKAIYHLSSHPENQRFFLWVHLAGPHWPNVFHEEVMSFGKSSVDTYDHSLCYADLQIGRLLDELERIENHEHLKIIIASDHGERFDMEWHYHGTDVSEEQIRIPLIVKSNDLPAVRTHELVSLLDLFPTILYWFGIEPPSNIDAIPLQINQRKRMLIADTWQTKVSKKGTVDRIAAFDGENKLVIDRINLARRGIIQKISEKEQIQSDEIQMNSLVELLEQYIEETGGNVRFEE